MLYLRKTGRDDRESRKGCGIQNRNRMVLAAAAAVMIFAAGCGKTEEPVPVEVSTGNMEEINEGLSDGSAEDTQEGKEMDGTEDKAAGGDAREPMESNGSDEPGNGTAELEGNVTSVEGDSFVISRTETFSEGDADIAASVAPGYEEEEDLVTVHVSQGCVWEFKTVKNGGINPEDISTREGSFADMKEGISASMKGNWQDDGIFLADRIVLMEFV